MKGLYKILFAFIVFTVFLPAGEAFAQGKRDPDAAYDPVNNRYLMVWEESDGANTNIFAQFRNPDGSVGAGTPTLISVPRTTQGCFYGQFDTQNGDITTPTDCPANKNPSVAFNNGQYIVVWEVHGTAGAPASTPDNQFINIFAKVINATTLAPLSGWEEGILISKVFIAANNAESSCGDRHACNDGQIQAWSKSINPDVAPRVGGQGFVVTWQTNKDFIGCADADRRRGWAVYGRYIDQSFSATSTTNPPAFAVFKDDSTMAESCEPTSNVDNGSNPRIAVNQSSSDFVIAYEVARASGGNGSIGAKQVTLDGSNAGQVSGSIMPNVVANVSGASLNNPEIISFKNHYILFASDGSNIRAKSFDSSIITASEPPVIALGGGSKVNPRASSNLGIGGLRSGSNPSPERMAVAYENGGDVFAVILNETLAVTRGPENISMGTGTSNRSAELSSDIHNFIAVWGGQQSGEQVFAEFISANDGGLPTPTPNVAPTVPGLLAPNDMVTFAPTRAYLNWNASTDSDGGTITYRIYFGENVIPATPQVSGVTSTHYVIGPETLAVTGITLLPNKTYKWKVEASDGQGGFTSSPVRTLMTDNSVLGWWKFSENPAGVVCPGGSAGETICDHSGNTNHGVPIGTPTWLPPPAIGFLDGALQFDGVNDTVSTGDIAEGLVALTVEARLRVNVMPGPGNPGSIVVKEHVSGFVVDNAGGLLKLNSLIGSGSGWYPVVTSVGSLTLGAIHRVATTYDAGQTRIYIDGGVDATAASGGAMGSTAFDRKIGALTNGSGTGNYINATMDEVLIYNKRLNDAEVLNNFNATDL